MKHYIFPEFNIETLQLEDAVLSSGLKAVNDILDDYDSYQEVL